MKSVYDLKLNESTTISVKINESCYRDITVLRVPGGWLYGDTKIGLTFVKYSDELLTDKK